MWPFMVVVAAKGNDCRLLMIVELMILSLTYEWVNFGTHIIIECERANLEFHTVLVPVRVVGFVCIPQVGIGGERTPITPHELAFCSRVTCP